MTRAEAVQRMATGIVDDMDDYGRLRALLDEQFDAALHHRSAHIADIGGRISALAETLEGRRAERVTLARTLTGDTGPGAMAAVFAQLPPALATRLRDTWTALEARVRECKELNRRNCELLMTQHEIMQRVLATETDTYVPR